MMTWLQPQPRYHGIRPIQIFLMRALYLLMFFVLGWDVWRTLLFYSGPWEEYEAVAWSVWGAFSALALLGFFRPIEMIPILLLEIFYKLVWLALMAVPFWLQGKFAGPGLAETTFAFTLIALVIVAVPWGYVVKRYILGVQCYSESPKAS